MENNRNTPGASVPPQPPPPGQWQVQPPLPNSTAILVLGILSLVFCGPIGLTCGIISLVLSGRSKMFYESSPGSYSQSSYSNVSSGRTCAIIGVVLNSIVVLFFIVYIILVFTIMSAAIPF